jgi:hypothetical protein
MKITSVKNTGIIKDLIKKYGPDARVKTVIEKEAEQGE